VVAGTKLNEKDNTRKVKLITLKQTFNIRDLDEGICVFKKG
jgi:hypothetical protein